MNTISNHSSITFYSPIHLKQSFDELVKFKRSSRTSILNFLMEQYVRTETKLLSEDKEVNSFLNDLKVRHHQNRPPKIKVQKDDELPMIPQSSDFLDDNWDDVSGVGFLRRLK